jgi:hypothetical protein
MNSHRLSQSRFLVGVILVIVAAAILLFTEGDYSTAGAIAIGVRGLISIAISRRQVS